MINLPPSESLEKLRKSRFLRLIHGDHKTIVFHSLLGNLHYAENEINLFFRLLDQGINVNQLQEYFPEIDIGYQIKLLRELKFLVSPEEDEQILNLMKRKEQSYRKGEMIRVLRLNVSTICNLACSYCYRSCAVAKQDTGIMSEDVAARAIELYKGLLIKHDHKDIQIRYFGGEPLINWKVMIRTMKDIYDWATQNEFDIMFHLNTNATLVSPHIRDILSEFRRNLVVYVSLDGGSDAHNSARHFKNGKGSYDLVCKGLDLLQEKNIPVVISSVVGEHNISNLCELIDIASNRNIRSLGLNPILITKTQNQEQLVEAFIEAIRYGKERNVNVSGLWGKAIHRIKTGSVGAYCGGIGNELSIMPNGNIYPCQSQPYLLGNLDDLESGEIFRTENYKLVSHRCAGNIPECRDCDFEGMCAGGCAGDAIAIHSDLFSKTQHCNFMQGMIRNYLETLLRENDNSL